MSRPASSSSDAQSLAILIGAPLLWLTMLEAAYLLSHWSCGSGMKWPLHVVMFGTAILLTGALWMRPRTTASETASSFLASMALWITVGFILVVIASAIQPAIIHPCG
jgi:hypothetical protein